jgi:hypothetical protein
MFSIRITLVAAAFALPGTALAQGNMAGMQHDAPAAPMKMAPNPLGISMDRAGSGTTWIPDAVKLPSLHFMRGNWDYMVHGFVFGQYTDQGGPRGDSQLGSLNWGMFMATHELAGGRFSFRTMLSLDPWTVTPKGYPLLLQTGETYDGAPLRDRQHPHDFWMEVGATYERAVTESVGFSLYAAPSGEPALSPVAFMHRPSAMDLPFAPLGHHWQDATHVSFGVVTAGLFGRTWKLEGSAFNGLEPDQERWNIEPIKLDSYSGRLTLNPTANWSATAGYGYMKSPERLDPGESMHRLTGSLMHGAKLGTDGQVASTFIYGGNSHHGHLSNAFLLESEAVLNGRSTLIGRAELIGKSAADLVLDVPPTSFASDREFTVGALTAGYIHEVLSLGKGTIGLGAMGTVNFVPSELEGSYGSRTPLAFTIFGRLRPSFGKADPMAGMSHH